MVEEKFETSLWNALNWLNLIVHSFTIDKYVPFLDKCDRNATPGVTIYNAAPAAPFCRTKIFSKKAILSKPAQGVDPHILISEIFFKQTPPPPFP